MFDNSVTTKIEIKSIVTHVSICLSVASIIRDNVTTDIEFFLLGDGDG